MKTILVIIAVLTYALVGCSDNSGSKQVSAPAEDSVYSSLIDLSSATDIKKLLCQNWENKSDAEDASFSGGGGSIEMPYRGFSFFDDATVVQDPRDKIRFGKWSFNDEKKLIELVYTDNKKEHFKIAAIGPHKMILLKMGDKIKTEYIADAKAHAVPANDPFHSSNNQWRIKPGRPESDSVIRQRVKQCVLFYAAFLKDNAERGGNVISFVGLPGCFKWYKGGISIINKDKLEVKWVNCFYSKEQSIKGQAMLEKIISKKYKWNKEESNWVKQSSEVMRQIYDTLR